MKRRFKLHDLFFKITTFFMYKIDQEVSKNHEEMLKEQKKDEYC